MDSCLDDSSDDDDNDIENELYSVYYYNDFSQGIPKHLMKKYDISFDGKNVSIALKSKVKEQIKENIGTTENSNSICYAQNNESRKEFSLNTTEYSSAEQSGKVNQEVSEKVIEIKNYSPSQPSISVISDDDSVSSEASFIVLDSDSSEKSKSYKRKNGCKESLMAGKRAKTVDNNEKVLRKTIILSSDDDIESSDFRINASVSNTHVDLNETLLNFEYRWQDVSSPNKWSKKMKKYYNKPSQSLINFDHRSMILEMRKKGEKWFVDPKDFYGPFSSRRVRCVRCQEFGHVSRNCKKILACKMCGTSGHTERQCPKKLCFNCGSRKSDSFSASCANCKHHMSLECDICQRKGHDKALCPDVWRRFHSTIEGEVKITDDLDIISLNKTMKSCCNCGQSGHIFEECRKSYHSPYPKPNSSVVNYKGEDSLSLSDELSPDRISTENYELERTLNDFREKGHKIRNDCVKGLKSVNQKRSRKSNNKSPSRKRFKKKKKKNNSRTIMIH